MRKRERERETRELFRQNFRVFRFISRVTRSSDLSHQIHRGGLLASSIQHLFLRSHYVALRRPETMKNSFQFSVKYKLKTEN
jgi:hypothetical protein